MEKLRMFLVHKKKKNPSFSAPIYRSVKSSETPACVGVLRTWVKHSPSRFIRCEEKRRNCERRLYSVVKRHLA